MQDIQEVNQKSFYYELKNGDPILQSQWCTAMAIDQNNEMVLMQQNGLIKCFQFKHNVLKILAIIQNPKEIVKVVMFLKNRSTFLSTKGDSIINWPMNLMQCCKFINKQKLHSNIINCLILNQCQNLMVSCSGDQTIKFWQQQSNLWFCQQTIIKHKQNVKGIAINQKGDQVISYGDDMYIIVMKFNYQEQIWQVQQKIKGEKRLLGLCIISDNIFTFQYELSKQLCIYTNSIKNLHFRKTQEIPITLGKYFSYSLSKFIPQKNILINFSGSQVNLLKINQVNQNNKLIYKLIQIIDFQSINSGIISEDGQYLITWDYLSKQVNIRSYQEINDV
ncbi:unnamed protein product [Paramecium pentaurelia]|uniref:Uncharacterized protein n=1 Tax=Paramecium pentaurelia TaxID=43138 RepID=A0A8S1Y1D8_9CILI|nr:unnamed protein product [Paramecium pentaurelia]